MGKEHPHSTKGPIWDSSNIDWMMNAWIPFSRKLKVLWTVGLWQSFPASQRQATTDAEWPVATTRPEFQVAFGRIWKERPVWKAMETRTICTRPLLETMDSGVIPRLQVGDIYDMIVLNAPSRGTFLGAVSVPRNFGPPFKFPSNFCYPPSYPYCVALGSVYF
jgi:hypothetical protein